MWVKPVNARCVDQWKKGRLTAINSRVNVEVDGVSRHAADIRKVITREEESDATQQMTCDDSYTKSVRVPRERRLPVRYLV